MPNSPQRALDRLKQVDQGLNSIEPANFESLAALLTERRAVLDCISGLDDTASLRQLQESAEAGAVLRSRLLLHVAALRARLAASLHRRSLSRALAPDQPPRGHRLRCSG